MSDDNSNGGEDKPTPRMDPERARRFISEPDDFVVELPEDRSDGDDEDNAPSKRRGRREDAADS